MNEREFELSLRREDGERRHGVVVRELFTFKAQ